MQKIIKLAYLVSNPIQYQAPLLKQLSECEDINLHVLFQSKRSLKPHALPGFNIQVNWDVDLLNGYQYTFLPCIGSDETFSFFRPWSIGLLKHLLTHKYDVLWVHGYSSFFNLYAIFLAKLLGIKVLVRGESHLLNRDTNHWRHKIRAFFFKGLNVFVDGFLTIGTANKTFYEYFNLPKRKLFFAPYVVDNDFFQSKINIAEQEVQQIRSDLQLDPKKPVILYASSMLERKHPEDLLEAYARLSVDGKKPPNAYLLFVGDGKQRSLLEKRVKELGWDTIRCLGFKNQTELPAYYKLCDVFVLPSEGETWGLVVNEAMNAGKAIIVTDQVGSGVDLVRNNENGFIYRVRDIQALSNALADLIAHPEKMNNMGQKSLTIIKQWGIPNVVQGICKACHSVISKKS